MQGNDICTYHKCTGCFACANVCPKECIDLIPNEYGEIHPVVDQSLCIDCNLCRKSCPNNIQFIYNNPTHCYAAWITDSEVRKTCASGGLGTLLSQYIIEQGGVIFGSRYNENMEPVINWTDKLEDLEYYKGSRYVQSLVGNDTFKQVRGFLQKGRMVLYIGTPCQIAGLQGFLKNDYDNLITVDLICHGVSPTEYLKQEVQYLSDKYHLHDISDIRFRGNDGNNFRLSLWNKERRKLFPRDNYRQKIFVDDFLEDYYLQGFLKGVSLRENCYSCSYARPVRISDITIGDFIGLGAHHSFKWPYYSVNISSVTTNTQKGYDLLSKVKVSHEELYIEERAYAERLEYRPSLIEPYKRDGRNEEFRKLYKSNGFPMAIRAVMQKERSKEYWLMLLHQYNLLNVAKRLVKLMLGPKGIVAAKKMLKR
jgi:coenzyme F420-reducing hydrogenase beta subunit